MLNHILNVDTVAGLSSCRSEASVTGYKLVLDALSEYMALIVSFSLIYHTLLLYCLPVTRKYPKSKKALQSSLI